MLFRSLLEPDPDRESQLRDQKRRKRSETDSERLPAPLSRPSFTQLSPPTSNFDYNSAIPSNIGYPQFSYQDIYYEISQNTEYRTALNTSWSQSLTLEDQCLTIESYTPTHAVYDINPGLLRCQDTNKNRERTVSGESYEQLKPVRDLITTQDRLVSNTADQNSLVCYGMLYDIEVDCKPLRTHFDGGLLLAWNGSTCLQETVSRQDMISLSSRTHQVFVMLVEAAQLDLQFTLERYSTRLSTEGQSSDQRGTDDQAFNLSVILYGTVALAIATGEWLGDIGLYLQIPQDCNRNVPYINPQCMSSDDEPCLTFDIGTRLQELPCEDVSTQSKVSFEDLYTETVFEECPQPAGMTAVLQSHQRQALTFMLQREQGWMYGDGDVWKREVDSYKTVRYRNQISGRSQMHPPKPFRGGILADDMGLGKTCTMLSLIATNRSADKTKSDLNWESEGSINATLIVVPFSLIGVWDKQIREHFTPNVLRTFIYHGQAVQARDPSFDDYDIVITTYNTIAYKWKLYKGSQQHRKEAHLFEAKWHRIVLDEAHVIRTRQTINARATCALRSDRRWCITGTPIQNRLSDLYGLLRFLGVDPYEEFKVFEEEMLRPLRCGYDSTLQKIQALMKAISIRRPKRVAFLPPSQERIEFVSLSTEEHLHYENARDRAFEVIRSAMCENKSNGAAYVSAFQRINDLRYICNHGTKPKRMQKSCAIRAGTEKSSFADQLDLLLLSSGDVCIECGTDLREQREGESNVLGVSHAELPEADSLQLCVTCLSTSKENGLPSPTPSSRSDSSNREEPPVSSKIQALLTQLQAVPTGEKAAVFSYWTSTLEAVAAALTTTGIQYTYFHGSLTDSKRRQVLRDFSTNPEISVILISITCGGQGLDLTAANHAFLVEPQWNPMLEEQAMSRVNRIGQTRPVQLVRLVVRDTWEEKICKLQEDKRDLAGLVVDRRPLKKGDEGKNQLYFLRELVT